MVRINKKIKGIFGFLTLVLLLGCPLGSPHYYSYKLLKKKIVKKDSIKLKMNISSNHLTGDKISLWNNINIINTTNHLIQIENISFQIQSIIFNYKLFNASLVIINTDKSFKHIPIYETKNKKLIKKNSNLKIKPEDSINFIVIYNTKEKIKEKKFIKLRKKDTVGLSVQFNKNNFQYFYVPIE